ncbi:Sas10/Utp3/C1D family-domain-containing protein [Phyllosticta citricarpa]|uniref:Sas10/Utp3/C1D family-domain-containing protein n=2 Tax=Phyllosticta TaxID=121621 RepID=A0ABR1MLD0_9PEZI
MATKTDNSLTALLSNLKASLTSASEIVPDQDAVLPPKDGISLLDVKNELLLSYLQNLVFLILLKIKNAPGAADQRDDTTEGASDLNDQVVKKLVELRLYLEKGVRPLEAKLKYQIDKVIRAAEDAARLEAQRSAAAQANGHGKASKTGGAGSDESEGGSGDDASESGSEEEDEGQDVDELAYRPNPAAFARPAAAAAAETKKKGKEEASDGIYRPPRITATAMPEAYRDRDDDGRRGPMKSAAIDEFIADELSAAPVAEPSIGSTIVSGGRRVKSQRERNDEAERRAYEETNMVRLPTESKKERAKKGKRDQRGGFGGEEWRDLGAGLDRIERLTAKKGGRSGAAGALDRSRKRAVDDGPRGDGAGAEAGAMFAKRRKTLKRRM